MAYGFEVAVERIENGYVVVRTALAGIPRQRVRTYAADAAAAGKTVAAELVRAEEERRMLQKAIKAEEKRLRKQKRKKGKA